MHSLKAQKRRREAARRRSPRRGRATINIRRGYACEHEDRDGYPCSCSAGRPFLRPSRSRTDHPRRTCSAARRTQGAAARTERVGTLHHRLPRGAAVDLRRCSPASAFPRGRSRRTCEWRRQLLYRMRTLRRRSRGSGQFRDRYRCGRGRPYPLATTAWRARLVSCRSSNCRRRFCSK